MQLAFLSFLSYLIPAKGAGKRLMPDFDTNGNCTTAKSNQVITDELQQSNLTCYTCSTFDNYTCRTFNASTEESFFIPRRDCSPEEIYCSVTRVEYMTNERILRTFWALERGCSSICIPGCIILGEGELSLSDSHFFQDWEVMKVFFRWKDQTPLMQFLLYFFPLQC